MRMAMTFLFFVVLISSVSDFLTNHDPKHVEFDAVCFMVLDETHGQVYVNFSGELKKRRCSFRIRLKSMLQIH